MSNRDIGIRALIPGQRSPDEIREDQNTKKYIETIVNQRAKVTPAVEPLGETLVRTTPSLNLELNPKDSTKEPRGFISKKEYENQIINSPTKQDHKKAFNTGNTILKAEIDPTQGAKYIPWYERMSQDEAESINTVKKFVHEESPTKSPPPKKVTAQDVINVYQKTLPPKKLHQKLEAQHRPTENTVRQLETLKRWGLSKHLRKPQ